MEMEVNWQKFPFFRQVTVQVTVFNMKTQVLVVQMCCKKCDVMS